MSALFSPLRLRDVEFRNRAWVSPMCQYSADDGVATDWHLVHLGSRAAGGAGLVMAEATAVLPEGRISPGCTGLWSDKHGEAFAPAARFIRSQGAVPGIQLAHAGRKASTGLPWENHGPLPAFKGGWKPVAPSSIPFDEGHTVPKALDLDGIADVVSAYQAAALRAQEAGFEVVELHFAHGYLVGEFFSPLTNKRDDAYGGSFDNRVRLAVEVTRAVREVWPEGNPLFARVSATDWAEGGWDLDQTVALAKLLKAEGLDLMDCSSGGTVPKVKIPAGPGYQVPFAEAVRARTGLPTAAVGFITEPKQAEEIVSSGKADAVFLARQFLREPYWPQRAAKELGAEAHWPKQYLRAK